MRGLLERGHTVVALDLSDDRHRVPIALDDLRYWSVARQEPYVSAVEATKAEQRA